MLIINLTNGLYRECLINQWREKKMSEWKSIRLEQANIIISIIIVNIIITIIFFTDMSWLASMLASISTDSY